LPSRADPDKKTENSAKSTAFSGNHAAYDAAGSGKKSTICGAFFYHLSRPTKV